MQRTGGAAPSAQIDEHSNGVSGVDSNDTMAAGTKAAVSAPNDSAPPTSDLLPAMESTAAASTEAASEPSGDHEAVQDDSRELKQQEPEPDPTAGAAAAPLPPPGR